MCEGRDAQRSSLMFIQPCSILQAVPSALPDPQPQGEGSVLIAEGAELQDVP